MENVLPGITLENLESVPFLFVLSSVYITEDENNDIKYAIVDQRGIDEYGEFFSLTEKDKNKIQIKQEHIDTILKTDGFECNKSYVLISIHAGEYKEDNTKFTFSQFVFDSKYSFMLDGLGLDWLCLTERKDLYVKSIRDTFKTLIYNFITIAESE